MQESSRMVFSYLSPTWTRSPSCSRIPTGTRNPVKTGIAPRCDPISPSHSRPPTSCRSIIRGRNPNLSRSPTGTGSP